MIVGILLFICITCFLFYSILRKGSSGSEGIREKNNFVSNSCPIVGCKASSRAEQSELWRVSRTFPCRQNIQHSRRPNTFHATITLQPASTQQVAVMKNTMRCGFDCCNSIMRHGLYNRSTSVVVPGSHAI